MKTSFIWWLVFSTLLLQNITISHTCSPATRYLSKFVYRRALKIDRYIANKIHPVTTPIPMHSYSLLNRSNGAEY